MTDLNAKMPVRFDDSADVNNRAMEDSDAKDTDANNQADEDISVAFSDNSVTFQGKSDCGFSDTIHDALMAVGQAVHNALGDPSEPVKGVMKETGDFVKDAAVAFHDFGNADKSMMREVREETSEFIKMLTSKDEQSADEDNPTSSYADEDKPTSPYDDKDKPTSPYADEDKPTSS